MLRPPGSPSPANALLDSALQPCKFLWVIAILQGLFTRFLWNMLVCTPAKLGGPHSGQAAYEELMLMALVHLVHLQLLVWFCGDQRHCLRITCNVACPP